MHSSPATSSSRRRGATFAVTALLAAASVAACGSDGDEGTGDQRQFDASITTDVAGCDDRGGVADLEPAHRRATHAGPRPVGAGEHQHGRGQHVRVPAPVRPGLRGPARPGRVRRADRRHDLRLHPARGGDLLGRHPGDRRGRRLQRQPRPRPGHRLAVGRLGGQLRRHRGHRRADRHAATGRPRPAGGELLRPAVLRRRLAGLRRAGRPGLRLGRHWRHVHRTVRVRRVEPGPEHRAHP